MTMGSSPNIKFSPGFKRILPLISILFCAVGIKRIIESFTHTAIYKKDFIQEYLMAKATINGINPYLPLPDLAAILMNYPGYRVLPHPTPHPPIVGLLSVPLGFLSYKNAALIWLIFELTCLFASLLLFLRWWKAPLKPARIAILLGFTLGWGPVVESLYIGQLNSCLLLLLLSAWLALRAEKESLGGALLGAAIALKLMAWPIVVFLAF